MLYIFINNHIMSIFDDNKDVFLPDFKWVFEEEDLIEGKKRMDIMIDFLKNLSLNITPVEVEGDNNIYYFVKDGNVYFMIKDIHGRKILRISNGHHPICKLDWSYYGNYFYDSDTDVYELPEALRESFHWMRRYLYYFEFRHIDKQHWTGNAFRHERKYKKYLKYGNNDRK